MKSAMMLLKMMVKNKLVEIMIYHSEGETDELTDIEESGDDKHAVTNAKARYFYPRICKCLVKDIDSVLDERN